MAGQSSLSPSKEVGERIKNTRKSRGLSQEQLASQISETCSSKVISRYENGTCDMRLLTFLEICNVLECTPNDLTQEYSSGEDDRIQGFHKLNAKNREIVETMVQALLLQQNQSL